MYLQKVKSRKNCVKNLFFAGILKVNDENSRIRIQNQDPDQNPDPSVRGLDPDPDPSITKQKKTLIPTAW